MGFDIPNLHIDEASPEGRVVREIIEREGVTPEEAVRLGLRRFRPLTPAEVAIGALSSPEDRAILDEALASVRRVRRDPRDIIGLFSSPEDRAIMDEAMTVVRESRDREIRQMRERLENEPL